MIQGVPELLLVAGENPICFFNSVLMEQEQAPHGAQQGEERDLPQEINSLIKRNQATLKRIDSIVDQMRANLQQSNGEVEQS